MPGRRPRPFGPHNPLIPREFTFPNIAGSLWELVKMNNPNLSKDLILELPSRTILDEAQAKLQSVGVDNLNDLGRLTVTRDFAVAEPGLIAPAAVRRKLFAGAPGGVLRPAGTAHPNFLMMASVVSWPQTDAVIIADELDLTNKTITIMREKVSHLWIIARRILASTGAAITYLPQVHPSVGVKGRDGSPNPAQPNYDRNARQSSSNHNRARDGGKGQAGGDGIEGPQGLAAPHLTILALEIDAMPDILLPGQQGGRGGAGGRGANGGDGQRGRDSESVVGVCTSSVGYGGYGGNGGDGGRGGRGGHGGRGGDVTVSTQERFLVPLITGRRFTLSNGPGPGGEPGTQGAPGRNGRGGEAGHASGLCRSHSSRRGRDGRNGSHSGDLGRGDHGSAGTIEYAVITEQEWILKLHSPWITALEPVNGFAGDLVAVKGLHFVNGTKVVFGTRTLTATFNYDRQVTFTVPSNERGGEHPVRVVTPDGDESNTVLFSVRPFIAAVQRDGQTVDAIAAGDRISLTGSSFSPGVSVLLNGEPLPAHYRSASRLELTVPAVFGDDGGGQARFMVQNPDGLQSNEIPVRRLPSLDSGFRPSRDGYAFHNYSQGQPTWGAFLETFGALEVGGELIRHPVLTGAFYLFYQWFLSNNGHCTGMAATSLQYYHQGGNDLFDTTPNTVHEVTPPDPPPISAELLRRLDVVQGRVISRELVVHYASQGREGLSRVEKTVRDIEDDFRRGMGESGARVLCYIPSGSAWDIITDEDVRLALVKSHCVTPTRIVYADESRSLDGARLYVYDNNIPGDDNLWIDLFMRDGDLHFEANYTQGNSLHYSTDTNFTLGTATLQKQLLDDVSLPFTGVSATASVFSFAVDLMLSPARITVEDEQGRIVGYKGGKMHSDPELGYVCPWLENYILTRSDAGDLQRTITGSGSGTYTYITAHPNGRSLTLKDAACSASTRDHFRFTAEMSSVEITSNEDKNLDLHLGEELPDGTVRYLQLACDLRPQEMARLELGQSLDGLKMSTPNRETDVRLSVKTFTGNRLTGTRDLTVRVPGDKTLELPLGMWNSLDTFSILLK